MSQCAVELRRETWRRVAFWFAAALVATTLAIGLARWRASRTSRDRWGAPALAATAAWLLAALGATRVAGCVGRRILADGTARLAARWRGIRRQVLLALVSLSVSLGAAELAARCWLPSPPLEWLHDYSDSGFDPNDWRQSFCQFDPVLGWRGIPNRRDWLTRPSFHVWVEQNADGFRDVEHPSSAAAGAQVFVLGDSFVWGCGVEQEETITARLRQRLAGAEIHNLGVCGYGTDQSLLTLCRMTESRQPEHVCYLFFPNDISDNQRAFNHGHAKPHFSLVDGVLQLANCPLPVAAPATRPQRATDAPPSPADLLVHPCLSVRRTADYYLSPHSVLYRQLRRLPHQTPDGPPSLALDPLTQALVLKMREHCHAHGARFTMALIPDRRVLKKSDAAAFYGPVREWCAENAVDCLDFTAALLGSPEFPYLDEGHWNEAGHDVAATALAEHIALSTAPH